jgi:ligand-binding sensor domain-containing protein/AraC-like DNA-binding protein/DNA-binding NarL/FixJ family response regulator
MKCCFKILFAFLFLFFSEEALAFYNFKTLDARDGLTSSQVTSIKKDSRGFVWFGTPAGLYRYDGYIFKHFQCDSQDGSTLPDSYILNIQEAIDGSLWIQTAVGYCIYHPQTESFERDMRQVFSNMGINSIPQIIYIDRYFNLWCYLSNRGVLCYNMQQQMLFEFGFTGNSRGVYGIPEGNICSISECKDGAILVYDNGLIVCCDVMHQQNVVWSSAELAQKELHHSSSLYAFADQKDNIWLYGPGTLYLYAKKSKMWNTTIGNQLGITSVHPDFIINGMSGDRSGYIWLATNRSGLIRLSVNTMETEQIPLTTLRPGRLMSMAGVQSVYVDDTDLLWVGTAKSGVAYWGENIYRFMAKMNGDITAIAEDYHGKIWYGTSDNGILDHPELNLASMKVNAMTFTKDGSMWVGSKKYGLTRIKNGKSSFYSTHSDSIKNALLNDNINALCVDNIGNLWIATEGGLQKYNLRMNTFSNYTKENNKLKINNVTALFAATGNKMLVGTSEGLTIMNISTNEVQHYIGNSTSLKKFTNNYVTCVFQDSRGLIWLGSREGVNILNLENDDLNQLTEKNGLCNNNVCGIAEDNKHNIWITTSNGVSRIVLQRNHEDGSYDYGLYNYTVNDGLQSNEFNLGSIYVNKNGIVYMGGLFGINWPRQQSADENEALPRVMLTQLFIGEEEILTGHSYNDNVPLPQTLNESNRIVLRNEQNTFTIKFAAGNYNQSERLHFNYWMEGLNDDWRNGDAINHSVTFTDLPSGTYKLHVKAISSERSVSRQERVLEIVIERPWYLQWWMLLFYVVVTIVTLYLWKIGIDQIKSHIRKKQALLGELAIQREEIKTASDDLRQPMARMTSIIMNLAERDSSLEEREQLNTLHSQMLQIITRVSDMQSALEHPEETARLQVNRHYELNSHGELNLPEMVSEELTSEIRSQYRDSPTSKFRVMFIDDNEEFIKFVDARLRYVYDFHSYSSITSASADVEMTMPDLIVCKQNMQPITGSELCNEIKSSVRYNSIKFVLVTDSKLSAQEMQEQGIALSADDYISKPFNIQEAAMRFNNVLGITTAVEMTNNLIEGAETRLLESHSSSMTTATETDGYGDINPVADDGNDEQMQSLEVQYIRDYSTENDDDIEFSEYSMNNAMDRQLIKNIEQYVQQNMSRGAINLEEMALAMGMSMRPFFLKIRDITGKTPADVVRDMRLKHACVLLKRTNINMSELATNVGFSTAEQLISIFKEKFNISPSEYRQKYRK